jgi:hypothetical protein
MARQTNNCCHALSGEQHGNVATHINTHNSPPNQFKCYCPTTSYYGFSIDSAFSVRPRLFLAVKQRRIPIPQSSTDLKLPNRERSVLTLRARHRIARTRVQSVLELLADKVQMDQTTTISNNTTMIPIFDSQVAYQKVRSISPHHHHTLVAPARLTHKNPSQDQSHQHSRPKQDVEHQKDRRTCQSA